jgi:hypothetical protein
MLVLSASLCACSVDKAGRKDNSSQSGSPCDEQFEKKIKCASLRKTFEANLLRGPGEIISEVFYDDVRNTCVVTVATEVNVKEFYPNDHIYDGLTGESLYACVGGQDDYCEKDYAEKLAELKNRGLPKR